MISKKETLVPLVATSFAVLATLHVLRSPCTKLFSRLRLQWKVSKADKISGTVSGLYIHPVKSLRAVSVQQAQLDDKGFVGDRRLMIVYPAPLPAWKKTWEKKDVTHRFLTQRQCPSLARVSATIDKENLTLTYEETTLTLSLASPSPRQFHRAKIWDDEVLVDDLGDEAAAFFQAIVNADPDAAAAGGQYKRVRLVIHAAKDRLADPEFTPATAMSWLRASPPPLSLTDGFPILIACQASLDELNRLLAEKGKPIVEMSRFRPNIVLTGTEAFEEDRWKYIAVGEQIFAIVKACPRCKQSCTDQTTGKVYSEPVETMKSFRALNESNKEDVFFAQNAIPLGACGTVQVGDKVRVLERGEPIYC